MKKDDKEYKTIEDIAQRFLAIETIDLMPGEEIPEMPLIYIINGFRAAYKAGYDHAKEELYT